MTGLQSPGFAASPWPGSAPNNPFLQMRNLIAVCVIASSENCGAYAVFDCDKGGEIDELASLRDGRYISQNFPKQ